MTHPAKLKNTKSLNSAKTIKTYLQQGLPSRQHFCYLTIKRERDNQRKRNPFCLTEIECTFLLNNSTCINGLRMYSNNSTGIVLCGFVEKR